jgi:hypothetical protein
MSTGTVDVVVTSGTETDEEVVGVNWDEGVVVLTGVAAPVGDWRTVVDVGVTINEGVEVEVDVVGEVVVVDGLVVVVVGGVVDVVEVVVLVVDVVEEEVVVEDVVDEVDVVVVDIEVPISYLTTAKSLFVPLWECPTVASFPSGWSTAP